MKRQSGYKRRGVRPEQRTAGPPLKDRTPAGRFIVLRWLLGGGLFSAGSLLKRPRALWPLTSRAGRRRQSPKPAPAPAGRYRPAETPLDLDDPNAAWGAMKLRPERTGLPMAVWITPNDGYQHDVRVKVSKLYGGGGSWTRDAVQVGVRRRGRIKPHEIVSSSLSAGDAALVRRWIELNHQLIVDVWDGRVDAVAEEVYPLLHKLPP
jgi:hypothetical protein